MGRWVSFKQDYKGQEHCDHPDRQDPYEGQEQRFILGPEESHHLASVLRARAGDPVKLLNGRGLIGTCTIKRIDPKGRVELTVLTSESKTQPKPAIELAVGLPKLKALEQILRQATELGVTAIRLLDCDHAAHSLEASAPKWKRLEAILIEACKQSLNPFLPKLYPPVAFEAYLETLRNNPPALKLVASLEKEAVSLKTAVLGPLEEIVCFVGPEGDFSAKEYLSLKDLGVLSLSLGPTILRVETAVVTMLAQVRGLI